MAKFGFIGMGNMGYAMLKGLLSVYTPSDIIFTCPDLEKCKRISQETGVRYAESNAECANNAQYVVLAVKPQVYNGDDEEKEHCKSAACYVEDNHHKDIESQSQQE